MSEAFEIVDQTLRDTLGDVLGIDAERTRAFEESSPLFGALPEFDSMAVATLLTELEDRLGITIDDDDLDISAFETFGALSRFLRAKAIR